MIDATRLWADIEALSGRTDSSRPWTRLVFSPEYLDGRAWLADAFRGAGLDAFIDAAGNLHGRLESGGGSAEGTIMIGSHSDTVRGGGRFDGVAGVLAGLEVARALRESGRQLQHALEVVDFVGEEPGEFGVSCIGSRAYAGTLPAEALERRDPAGRTLATALREIGGDPARVFSSVRTDVAAFFELHIEQGPVLEQQGVDVGVVENIVGIVRIEVELVGKAAHAGTTPIAMRHDALAAAAELVTAIELDASAAVIDRDSVGQHWFVATVGRLEIAPNAANVVPGSVRLVIDLRCDDQQLLDAGEHRLHRLAGAICKRRGIELGAWRIVSRSLPARCDATLSGLLEMAARDGGHSVLRMTSGAGHDCAWMTRVAPSALLFVPSRNGISHSADEWTDAEALRRGTETLATAILAFDASARRR